MPAEPARVGIVLPFHRAGRFIAEAIESVLDQREYYDWHLYLVNDGSDDRDVSIAREFCRQHTNKLTYLEHPGARRRGTSASRNLAISNAPNELIAFLDADDVWSPDKLSFQVAVLDANPNAAMIYGPALRWHSWNGEPDREVPAAVDGFGSNCLVPGEALLATFLRDESLTPCTGSVLIRASALRRVGGFEEDFRGLFDDQVLYAKLCASAHIFVSSHCVSRYRQHPDSTCRQSEVNYAAERVRFLSWLDNYRRSHFDEPAPSALSSR